MRTVYSYYMTQRPPQIGAMPKNGLQDILFLDEDENAVYVPEIGHHAYAILRYQRELTDKEISDYELTRKD